MAKAPTKRKRVPRQVGEKPCQYCGDPVRATASAMRYHIQRVCEKAPAKSDEGELPPGTIVDRGTGAPRKIPWTVESMKKLYPQEGWVLITPPRTQKVTVNGLSVDFVAGNTVKAPSIFVDVFWDSWRSDGNILAPRQATDEQKRALPYEHSKIQILGMGAIREES